MIAFRVDDMTCGHCVSTIAKALKHADKDAKVVVDLAKHLVLIEPAAAEADALREAIAEAGYTPTPVESATAEDKAKAKGCCGRCH
jgi:copper chaperone